MKKEIPPIKDPPKPLIPARHSNSFSSGNFLKSLGGIIFGPAVFSGTALNFVFFYSPLKFLYTTELKSRKTSGSLLKTFFSDDRALEGIIRFFEGALVFGAKRILRDPYKNLIEEVGNLVTTRSPLEPIDCEKLEKGNEKTPNT